MHRFALLCFSLVLACRSEPSDGDEVDLHSQWVADYTAAKCQLMLGDCECTTSPPSQAECQEFYASYFQMKADARAPELAFDPACADQVLERLEEFACGTQADFQPQCDRCFSPSQIFHGDVGEGAPCTEQAGYSDCAVGLECDSGVCVSLCNVTVFGEGEMCFDEEHVPLGVCDDGLRCDHLTLTCVPVPALGEACPDGACEPGTHCNSDPVMPVCVASPADGEPCPDNICASSHSTCEGQPAICVPTLWVCEQLN
jgi:hypothetical protein